MRRKKGEGETGSRWTHPPRVHPLLCIRTLGQGLAFWGLLLRP